MQKLSNGYNLFNSFFLELDWFGLLRHNGRGSDLREIFRGD